MQGNPERRAGAPRPLLDDPYRHAARPPGPAVCPECRAYFRAGRWAWGKAPADASPQLCAACQRIQDRFPAGYLSLKGAFVEAHRDEILGLIHSHERREKAERPLQRIMAIDHTLEGIEVTTTDSLLARGIGEALHEAYKGELKLRYSRDENLLRATWRR